MNEDKVLTTKPVALNSVPSTEHKENCSKNQMKA